MSPKKLEELSKNLVFLKDKGYIFKVREDGGLHCTFDNVTKQIFIPKNITYKGLRKLSKTILTDTENSPIKFLEQAGCL